MSMPEQLIPGHRCWESLATTSVGRLALSVRALPVILSVQYYLDGPGLAICLGHHQIRERSLNDVIIAFAADAIDPVTRSGWWVQVQGRSVIPRRLDVDTACGRPTAGQIVQMETGIISGHHTRLCPFIDALLTARQTVPRCDLRVAGAGHRSPGGLATGTVVPFLARQPGERAVPSVGRDAIRTEVVVPMILASGRGSYW
jgi:hypothetical protein